jgi:hypothetical protein
MTKQTGLLSNKWVLPAVILHFVPIENGLVGFLYTKRTAPADFTICWGFLFVLWRFNLEAAGAIESLSGAGPLWAGVSAFPGFQTCVQE